MNRIVVSPVWSMVRGSSVAGMPSWRMLLKHSLLRKGFPLTSTFRNKSSTSNNFPVKTLQIPKPQVNVDKLCNPERTAFLHSNLIKRKSRGNIHNLIKLYQELQNPKNDDDRGKISDELLKEALKIPNETHPEPFKYGEHPKEVRISGEKPMFTFKPKEFSELANTLNILHHKRLTPFCGNKGYYLLDELSELEHGLIRFTIDNLRKRGFHLISVPDILHQEIIENCGMDTKGPRNQIYRLDPEQHSHQSVEGNLCLSGTAEMALGGYLMNHIFQKQELPLKVISASRCYRAEVGVNAHEKGIYRVHYFTKVEMFGVSTPDESELLLNEFVSIQEELFSSLGLCLRTLDMPPCELGAPAYRKYDVEAWMPGHNMYGELSSSSDCTDYQSRRLNIRYSGGAEEALEFAHTVNGTACAIPRLIVALCETHQQANGGILIPKPLQPYMKGKTALDKKSILKGLINHGQLGELESRSKQRVRMKRERPITDCPEKELEIKQ